jgi:hypothetical protein
MDDRRECARAHYCIARQVQLPLVAAESRRGLLPEVAVEGAGVHAAPRQEELEHRDIPAEVAWAQRPSAEEGPAEWAERRAQTRICRPVPEPVAGLERLDRRGGSRPGEAVDLREIETVCP